MLSLASATYHYPGAARPSLLDVSLKVPDGQVIGLVGASEAGKSTLCLVLGGLAPRVVHGTLTGALRVDGVDVSERPMHELATLVGSCLQDPAGQLTLIAETVFEEVAFGPANLGLPRAALIAWVESALERVGVADLAGRDPRTLSGGQCQLVAIASLLAMRPRHLVLDEPTAHLDPSATRRMMDVLAGLAAEGTAILVAEHKSTELARICSRVAVIDEGRIVSDGRALDVLSDPRLRDWGIEELPEGRLQRLAREAGLYGGLLDATGGT